MALRLLFGAKAPARFGGRLRAEWAQSGALVSLDGLQLFFHCLASAFRSLQQYFDVGGLVIFGPNLSYPYPYPILFQKLFSPQLPSPDRNLILSEFWEHLCRPLKVPCILVLTKPHSTADGKGPP
jgi:hypothetical protein